MMVVLTYVTTACRETIAAVNLPAITEAVYILLQNRVLLLKPNVPALVQGHNYK